VEWASDEDFDSRESGSDYEPQEKTTRGKRKAVYKEHSDEDESDEAWAPGKALKVSHTFFLISSLTYIEILMTI